MNTENIPQSILSLFENIKPSEWTANNKEDSQQFLSHISGVDIRYYDSYPSYWEIRSPINLELNDDNINPDNTEILETFNFLNAKLNELHKTITNKKIFDDLDTFCLCVSCDESFVFTHHDVTKVEITYYTSDGSYTNLEEYQKSREFDIWTSRENTSFNKWIVENDYKKYYYKNDKDDTIVFLNKDIATEFKLKFG